MPQIQVEQSKVKESVHGAPHCNESGFDLSWSTLLMKKERVRDRLRSISPRTGVNTSVVVRVQLQFGGNCCEDCVSKDI